MKKKILILLILSLIVFPVLTKAESVDTDNDGLSDDLELIFKTDPNNPDTDGDGFLDGLEIDWGYDPLSDSKIKLPQKIEIDLKKQKMYYFVSSVKWKEFIVSTGKSSMPTPKGTFSIKNKIPKAWSRTYGLWMPYWMAINGPIGIHELPIWPGGYREGESHLGKAVSHGCIRLGTEAAPYLFDRVIVGTPVVVY